MIDPRSFEHLSRPFDHVDGERVRVLAEGPLQGAEGRVLHQVGLTLRGVVCRLRLDGGERVVDVSACSLLFLRDSQRGPKRMRALLSEMTAPRRRELRPFSWGVWDSASGDWARDASGAPLTGLDRDAAEQRLGEQ